MYRIKRFSILNLDQKEFADLSDARDKIADEEKSLSCHIMSFMAIEDWMDNNIHWSKEIVTFIKNATEKFNDKKLLKKLYHRDMFPTFLSDTHISDYTKQSIVSNKMKSEGRSDLIKFASSDLFVTILTEFCDKCDEYVKKVKRTITTTSSDKEFISDTLHSIREDHYDDLSSWRK